jgi:hypothetical protein
MDRFVKIWDVPNQRFAQTSEQKSKQESPADQGGGVRAACKSEIEKLCPGEERVGRCLRKQQEKLSLACRSAMGQGGHRN